MTPTEIVFGAITVLCLIITTVLAIMLYNRRQDVAVSFTGVPVDKKDFEKHIEEDFRDHDALHARIGGMERGVEKRLGDRIEKVDHAGNESRRLLHKEVGDIGREVSALKANSDNTADRVIQMDSKLDRVIADYLKKS